MQWTPEQEWALDADRHAVVTASAGSGKTAVLVGYYVRLVLSGVDPQSIVTITFTRKAAAEMYARIAAEIDRRIAAATEPRELAFLKPLRERLTGAPISTIHSFCAQLLRRFPIEAGVLPTFTELTEAEAQRLARETTLRVVEELLLDGRMPELRELLREYGRRETVEFVLQVLQQVERWVILQPVLAPPEERLRQAHRRLWGLAETALRFVLAELQRLLDAAANEHGSEDEVSEVSLLCRRIAAKMPVTSDAEGEELLHLWHRLRERAFRRTAHPRAWLVAVSSPAPRLSRAVEMLDAIAEAWQNRAEDERMLHRMEVLARLVGIVREQLAAEKAARNALDFNDLQLLALRLLEHPTVVERLRREIHCVLVDEFQDTNPVQYELIRRLLALEETQSWVGPRVFLVGDPKQSIYGFRDADVHVFERARNQLLQRNQWAVENGILPVKASAEATTGDIHLPVSFRLAPQIVAFVNRVAGCVFSQLPEQVAYEPLVCGRPQAQGSVRFLVATESAQTREPLGLSEEELIARSIRRWVSGEEPLTVSQWDAASGREIQRPVRYGDIAIIARYRLSVPRLTAVLQRYGIPYIVHAGAGFFQAPEVQDLYFLLRFLVNERDDFALAVALRSPLFALTDEELLHISSAEGESFWQKLQRCARQDTARDALRRAADVLEVLRLLAARLTPAELIRTITERTLWLLRLRRLPRFPQIEANVGKLLEFARAFHARGLRTLADFVQELGALIETELPEAEAVLPVGMDVVSLLTVHAAKGLEFPVVILYRTAETRTGTQALFLDETLGIVTQPRRWEPDSGIWQPVSTPAYVVARAEEDARREAEEQRVLYVGLTRARDHLVVAGTLALRQDGTASTPRGLLGFILEGLGMTPDELLRSSAVSFSEPVELYADGQRVCTALSLQIPVVRDVPPGAPPEPRRRQWLAPIVLPEPIPVHWSQERLSATHYALFRHDPESFVRRAVLGFPATPEELLSGAVVPSDSERELPEPLVLGYLLHQLLALLPRWTTPGGAVLPDHLAELARTLVEQSPYASASTAVEWLRECAAAVVSTPLVQRYWPRLHSDALREYSLTIPLGENFLTGTMDVLLPHEEGWEIWDWKLGAVRAPEDCLMLARRYEPQMQVYAYLVLRRFPEQHRIRVRLLFVEAARPDAADEEWGWSAVWDRQTVMGWEEGFAEVAQRLFLLGQ